MKPKRSGKKRLDVVQNARRVVDESLRRFEESESKKIPNPTVISQVMAEMGRRGGRIGGRHRMDSLTAQERSELGKAAVRARWDKYRADKRA